MLNRVGFYLFMILHVDSVGQQISGLPAEGETYPASLNGPEFQGTNAVGINVQSQVISLGLH